MSAQSRSRIPARRSNRRRGAAMLEAALTLLVFITMVIGVLDFGQFLYIHQSMTERVRSAARSGAIRSLDETAIKNLVAYGTLTAPGDNVPGFLGLRPANVNVVFDDINTNGTHLVVSITGYRYPVFSPLIAGSFQNMAMALAVPMETP